MNKESLVLKLIEMLVGEGESAIGGAAAGKSSFSVFLGQKVIIRSRDAGVHFGTLVEETDNSVVISESRRMDRFYIAGNEDSLSGVARCGIISDKGRISGVVPTQKIINHCEIIPIADEQAKTIESAPVYNKE